MNAQKIHYDGTINAGSIISGIVFLIAGFMGYATLKATVENNVNEVQEHTVIIKQLPSDYVPRNEFKAEMKRLERMEGKIDLLLKERLGEGN